MKTLMLLRHAKSSWADPSLDDHDRPLDARGERAAAAMGIYLRQLGACPSLVLCSSARRTRETFSQIQRQLPAEPEVRMEAELYLAPPRQILERLHRVGDEHDRVLLVGHNPSFADLAKRLAGRGDRDAIARLGRKFPTGALAVFNLPVEHWRDAGPGAGELTEFTAPKDLV